MKAAAVEMYGARGWQKSIARALDYDVSGIRKLINRERVPRVVELSVLYLKEQGPG